MVTQVEQYATYIICQGWSQMWVSNLCPARPPLRRLLVALESTVKGG